jgi:hypothetical protein
MGVKDARLLAAATLSPSGALAEWLRSGLQSLLFFAHFLPLWSRKSGGFDAFRPGSDYAGSRMIPHYFGRFWQ